MNYRSHTQKEIEAAQKEGKEIYYLSTESGDDDVLIGSYNECLQDVLNYHEIEELPDNWNLEIF